QVFGLDKGLIAVEDNKMDAVDTLRKVVGTDSDIEIKVMKTKYPQGDERQIIYALTGVELKAGKLPADVGCVIFNSETCYNVYRAVAEGMPLIDRIVTVSGDCVNEPKNLLAPLGTPVSELIEFCGGLKKEPRRIITGGPMMGVAQWDTDTPVTKGTNAVLALSEEFIHEPEIPAACLHCGKCLTVCPMHLMPLYLAQHAKNKDFDTCEKYNILSCVECGSCAYICPGRVPLVQLIRLAKGAVNEKKRALAAANAAKENKEEKK
ncbi:MAG: RnfABCDGE type electron transport complex subunit C, partial [Clostridia bacterium]|nr:RnfABCDGE type electron transport complex subunit C [Clostridia bacterium]